MINNSYYKPISSNSTLERMLDDISHYFRKLNIEDSEWESGLPRELMDLWKNVRSKPPIENNQRKVTHILKRLCTYGANPQRL